MIATLQLNVPMFLMRFSGYGLLYIKQYGPGNLRLKGSREELLASINPLPLQDGIVQVTADGFKQYFWSGDLWAISDAPGSIVFEAPGYSFYIDRGLVGRDPNAFGNVINPDANIDSTYHNMR